MNFNSDRHSPQESVKTEARQEKSVLYTPLNDMRCCSQVVFFYSSTNIFKSSEDLKCGDHAVAFLQLKNEATSLGHGVGAHEQEVKQIHTSGPSRAVQRSVSVLGETGFVHKDSAIWRSVQIRRDAWVHAWGKGWDGHRVGVGNGGRGVTGQSGSAGLLAWAHIMYDTRGCDLGKMGINNDMDR